MPDDDVTRAELHINEAWKLLGSEIKDEFAKLRKAAANHEPSKIQFMTRVDAVAAIVKEVNRPITLDEIAIRFRESGRGDARSSITVAASNAVYERKVIRVHKGVYGPV